MHFNITIFQPAANAKNLSESIGAMVNNIEVLIYEKSAAIHITLGDTKGEIEDLTQVIQISPTDAGKMIGPTYCCGNAMFLEPGSSSDCLRYFFKSSVAAVIYWGATSR